MVNKCAGPKCKTDCKSIDNQLRKLQLSTSSSKKPDLNKQWIRFADQINLEPTQHSVLCELHFEEYFTSHKKGYNLKMLLNPVPIIYSAELHKSPSSLTNLVTKRKQPTQRIFQ